MRDPRRRLERLEEHYARQKCTCNALPIPTVKQAEDETMDQAHARAYALVEGKCPIHPNPVDPLVVVIKSVTEMTSGRDSISFEWPRAS